MEKLSYECKNVTSSSHTSHNLSRHELLQWINDSLELKLLKVESLCSGAVYCQFMNKIFPGCISLKKVKFEATQEHEYMSNLKQLQLAFRTVGCDKDVPIQRLIKGRFQENFEFLQWFRRFYEANCDAEFLSPAKVVKKQPDMPSKKVMPQAHTSYGAGGHSATKQKELSKDLETEISDLKDRVDILVHEKEYYFKKLRKVEEICTELKSDSANANAENPGYDKKEVVKKILSVLYAEDDRYEEEEETY